MYVLLTHCTVYTQYSDTNSDVNSVELFLGGFAYLCFEKNVFLIVDSKHLFFYAMLNFGPDRIYRLKNYP